MSLPKADQTSSIKAEDSFREAFVRLRTGSTKILPKGSPVSQNNVAREAGADPSALRKSRYPLLISEIQRWIRDNGSKSLVPSERQVKLKHQRHNRSLKSRIQELQTQRDHLASILVEADTKILELTLEILRLQELIPSSNIRPIRFDDHH